MRTSLIQSLVLCTLLVACGGTSTARRGLPRGGLALGDTRGVPSLATLPADGIDRRQFSERMTRGWDLAMQTFIEQAPDAPPAHDSATLTTWSQGPLATWLRRRTELVAVARRELDGAAEESSEQRVVGGAIVGLMYEDVGRSLTTIPVPDELRSEPEIAAVYADLVTFQAAPWVERARLAYHACRENARLHAIEPYARFCEERGARLPAAHQDPRSTNADVVRRDTAE